MIIEARRSLPLTRAQPCRERAAREGILTRAHKWTGRPPTPPRERALLPLLPTTQRSAVSLSHYCTVSTVLFSIWRSAPHLTRSHRSPIVPILSPPRVTRHRCAPVIARLSENSQFCQVLWSTVLCWSVCPHSLRLFRLPDLNLRLQKTTSYKSLARIEGILV